jgi:hypothetical protein
MTDARRSYLKTLYMALVGMTLAVIAETVVVYVGGSLSVFASIPLLGGSLACVSVVIAGCVVLHRERRSRDGRTDLFIAFNRDRSESELARLPIDSRGPVLAWFLRWWPGKFKVGNVVEVRTWEEIQRTLGEDGTLDGVPFMREMLPFCGRQARILRYVDKVYDYGGTKTLRRMDDCVLLVNARCDGSAHGGCKARCSTFWKTAWLKPLTAQNRERSTSPSTADAASQVGAVKALAVQTQEPFACQYTSVVAASTSMPKWSLRRDLIPLLRGNVSVKAFVVALLTWEFNWIQNKRGGIAFPAMTNSGLAKMPVVEKGIQVDRAVSVLSMDAIASTLDVTSRNRGLWFDREMIKHCRQPGKVLDRVEKIIDDRTRRMVPMKTACIILEDVVASGEFLHFCPQQEYLFWREAWLDAATTPTARESS